MKNFNSYLPPPPLPKSRDHIFPPHNKLISLFFPQTWIIIKFEGSWNSTQFDTGITKMFLRDLHENLHISPLKTTNKIPHSVGSQI